MKVVLLHDWLTGFRGGERVLEVFCEMFPEAPIYTLIYQKGTTSPIIENRKIQASFLNCIPGVEKHYRKFLPFFPLAASRLKIIEDCDLVLSSSHCVIKGVKKPKGSKHLSYIHSPMRYIYDQFENYFGKDAPLLQRLGAKCCRPYLQHWDRASNKNVDQMIANSAFVQKRIKDFYFCDSKVIHPFVDLKDFREVQNNPFPKEDFYLMVTAFAPNKRVSLAIEAFNELDLPLKIVGGGQQENELKEMAKSNIQFLGNVSREDVVTLMNKARGFIFPGVEDFGITPLESLAAGTPVVARKIGGVLETLNDDVAEFFLEDDVSALIKAIRSFEKRHFERAKLLQRAEDFSKETFKKKIEAEIQNLIIK